LIDMLLFRDVSAPAVAGLPEKASASAGA
jgi:hypothetical protein